MSSILEVHEPTPKSHTVSSLSLESRDCNPGSTETTFLYNLPVPILRWALGFHPRQRQVYQGLSMAQARQVIEYYNGHNHALPAKSHAEHEVFAPKRHNVHITQSELALVAVIIFRKGAH